MIAIQTENLTKVYSGKKVVDAISLNIEEGKVFGFLGPNGAGKTTTIRMLLGLVKATSGTARILGFDIKNDLPKLAENIAAIVETPTFFPNLTAIQTLQTFADYCRLKRTESELLLLLEKCGILFAAKQKVNSFSLGMKQRLGIAAALLNDPQVIFLDEPTNGLDPDGILQTRRLIRRFAEEERRTIFLSSHLLNEVEQTCDEVAILVEGKIKAQGNVKDLLRRSRILIKAKPFAAAAAILQNSFAQIKIELLVREEQILLDIEAAEIPLIIEKLVESKIEIYEVSNSSQSLEELFHQIVRSQ